MVAYGDLQTQIGNCIKEHRFADLWDICAKHSISQEEVRAAVIALEGNLDAVAYYVTKRAQDQCSEKAALGLARVELESIKARSGKDRQDKGDADLLMTLLG